MKLDVRNPAHKFICLHVMAWDNKTGSQIPLVVAGDDSTGQIVRYIETPERGDVGLRDLKLISEILDFYFVVEKEAVYLLPNLTGYQGGIINEVPI